MCVDLCYRALAEQNNAPTLVRAKCFHTLDAYVRLITLLVKHSGETANTVTKVCTLYNIGRHFPDFPDYLCTSLYPFLL